MRAYLGSVENCMRNFWIALKLKRKIQENMFVTTRGVRSRGFRGRGSQGKKLYQKVRGPEGVMFAKTDGNDDEAVVGDGIFDALVLKAKRGTQR